MIHPDVLRERFRATYGTHPVLCRAPGRVNLIGEHTDYNDGFVLPAAIDFFTWAAVQARNDARVHIASTEMNDVVSTCISDGLQPRHDWSDYVVGVLAQLKVGDLYSSGADFLIHGEVPIGAGLSSSAAIEVATGLAAATAHDREIDRTALALLCQRAENEFVGTKCGIMDQFVSCHGKAGHALILDCRTLEFSLVPLPSEVRLVVCNTMIKHALAGGEYNLRRQQCETGVRLLSEWFPGITALRDVTVAQFEDVAGRLPELIARRCRHVITENDRVQHAAAALRSGALYELGPLMAQSHLSLKNDYEVSCPELDLMVELAAGQPGLYGARMTGGGFGGCTVNLVAAEDAPGFARHMESEYLKATNIQPQIYLCTAAEGACEIRD